MFKPGLALGFVVTTAGCMCTDAGCIAYLTVTFTDMALEDGAYRAVAELPSGRSEEVLFDMVEGEAVPVDGWSRPVSFDGVDLVVGFPIGSGGFEEAVPVSLLDGDDAVIVEGEVVPDWGGTFYPNGKRCGGGCTSGSAEL